MAVRWRKLYHRSYFLQQSLNAVDASLSIMFNFDACPAFYNVLYKTSYAFKMSVSLLLLMGNTIISYVSYACTISICCIPILLITGMLTFKSLYAFTVSVSDRYMAANKEFFFPLLGKKMFPSPVLVAHYLLI